MSKQLALLDVTLRDGGYVNQHSFTPDECVAIATATAGAGVEMVEVGYFRPRRAGAEAHPAACAPAGYLRHLRAVLPATTGLVVMAHVTDCVPADLDLLAASGVSLVRLPARPDRVPLLAPYVERANELGMRASVNLIRVSELDDEVILGVARRAEEFGATYFYMADSNGALLPDRVGLLVRRVRDEVALDLGFHAHDGLEMAFANSLAAIEAGATVVDGSLGGMGKGGGNLVLELVAGYLRVRCSRAYAVGALTEAARTLLAPWFGDLLNARHDHLASSLLNLNLDDIARHAGGGSLVRLLETPPGLSDDRPVAEIA